MIVFAQIHFPKRLFYIIEFKIQIHPLYCNDYRYGTHEYTTHKCNVQ